MFIERKIVPMQLKAVFMQVETVPIRVNAILVQVRMADVLTDEYFGGEKSVILKNELTVVVKEKLCIHPWISVI